MHVIVCGLVPPWGAVSRVGQPNIRILPDGSVHLADVVIHYHPEPMGFLMARKKTKERNPLQRGQCGGHRFTHVVYNPTWCNGYVVVYVISHV